MKRNGVEYVECKRADGCKAPADSGHWCPASADQVRDLGYPEPREVHDRELDEARESYISTLSPFVRRALAGELPAKEYAR